jgi:aminoglycoside 2'-N-acetyltransferase I
VTADAAPARTFDVRLAHTADVDAATLATVRALLDAAFDDDFSDEDWEHALGGMHALGREDGQLVAHASVVQRRLLHGGRALRTGYVEGVGVRADRRRRGYGGAVMGALERVIRGAYELGALAASDEAIALYARRGWRRWDGPTSALTPAGIVRTEDADGAVYVLPLAVPLDTGSELTCDWRGGEVW